MGRIVALVLSAILAGCAAPQSTWSVDGHTCTRYVTRTFWVPCGSATTWRT